MGQQNQIKTQYKVVPLRKNERVKVDSLSNIRFVAKHLEIKTSLINYNYQLEITSDTYRDT